VNFFTRTVNNLHKLVLLTRGPFITRTYYNIIVIVWCFFVYFMFFKHILQLITPLLQKL
jgi:hypothetical protein